MKPDFLGIGAPRSATSWLHRALASQPDLWLPPVKELHWLDVQRRASHASYPIPGADPARIARQFRRDHRRLLLRELRRGKGWSELRFAARYLLGRRSDDWYASLFPRDKIAGEITPAYMILPRELVEAIAAPRPGLRAILLMRDPIDRIWSGTRHFALSGRPPGEELDAKTRARVVKRFDTPGVRLRTDYRRALETWRGVLGPDRVFVGFYDDVQSDPAGLLGRILEFLGADPAIAPAAPDLARRVNAAETTDLPRELAVELARRYREPLRELAQEFGGPPARWLARAEALVGGSGPSGS
jgi:hypothetical protein